MSDNARNFAERSLLCLVILVAGGCVVEQADGGGDRCEQHEAPPPSVTLGQALIDCSEREDTGYVRGEPFAITVVTVDGKPVERETANAYWVMQQAAARDGVTLRVVSGFRTNAEQRYLRACYENCNCNDCNLAARPGYSNHQSGHALDLNTSDGAAILNWLNNNGSRFGFSRTVPGEPWHWEWWGGGPGGGPCDGEPCQMIEGEGGTLDDGGPCFERHGPAQYWRQEEGQGFGGGLQWTNAFEADEPSNWARWHLHFDEPGEYSVEVNTGGSLGIYDATRYRVRHDGGRTRIRVDQSLPDEWKPLGTFSFAAGGDQHVDVFDNSPDPVSPDQRIVADAVRVTRLPCRLLGSEGGVLDEAGPCFRAFGPAETWRLVEGQGHGGSLMWTNAFEADEPGNWARWRLYFEQAGRYRVEVLTDGEFGVWAEARYSVRHDGQASVVQVDQSLPDGWQPLGEFYFAAGGHQSVDLFDNHQGQVPPDQHMIADAVRISPVMETPDPTDPPDPPVDPNMDPDGPAPGDSPTPEEPAPLGDDARGEGDADRVTPDPADAPPQIGARYSRSEEGCSMALKHGRSSAPGLWIILALLGFFWRRPSLLES